jgi:hypothetical protein
LTAIAWIIYYKYLPETANCSLDEVEGLFMSKEQYEKYQAELKQEMEMHEKKQTF